MSRLASPALLALALLLCLGTTTAAAQSAATAAGAVHRQAIAPAIPGMPAERAAGRAMPTWMKWGVVGAVTGAIVFPLLGALAGDTEQRIGRDAAAGAVSGFVIVGGSVALWQAVCSPDSASRRAGLCGR